MKCVLIEHVKNLQLHVMNYPRDALLIWEEYHHVLEELMSQVSGKSRGGGVLVTGQQLACLFYVLFFHLSEGLPMALQMLDKVLPQLGLSIFNKV